MSEALLGTIRRCTGCGAAVVFDGPSLSLSCSYCDGPMVDEDRAAATIDAIVPFAIPERGALERIRVHLDRQRWAPRQLRELRVHARGLRGVLVPFYAYDGVVRSRWRGRVGVDWTRTEEYQDEQGKTRTREVTETEWLPAKGSAAVDIDDCVVSASVGLPAHEANPLEPFDLGRAVGFDPRLLSGFEAELASISAAEAEPLAIARIRDAEAARVAREQLPGDRNRLDDITSEVSLRSRRLVLLPVWIASYRHGDVHLRVLVNGQTGEVVGRVPIDRVKLGLVVLAWVTVSVAIAWWLHRGGPT